MRIGVIASSGGSVFAELVDRLAQINLDNYEFCVITDRSCKIENFCDSRKIEHHRIEITENLSFSKKANEIFSDFGNIDCVLLFFSRLVTKDIYENYSTFNFHPSLLPAFRGLNPINQAIKAKVKFFGATLHLVDNSVDNGPIIGQVCIPIRLNEKEKFLQKISFIQKVYLSFLALELLERKCIDNRVINYSLIDNFPITDRCNPYLTKTEFINSISQIQMDEKIEVIK